MAKAPVVTTAQQVERLGRAMGPRTSVDSSNDWAVYDHPISRSANRAVARSVIIASRAVLSPRQRSHLRQKAERFEADLRMEEVD